MSSSTCFSPNRLARGRIRALSCSALFACSLEPDLEPPIAPPAVVADFPDAGPSREVEPDRGRSNLRWRDAGASEYLPHPAAPPEPPSDAGIGAAADGAAADDPGLVAPAPPLDIPGRLSEAGLYEADMQTFAEGVRPYRPRYELWADGASKRRWVWLPEGEFIDTGSMEYWIYPSGTRLYKEFSVDGVRVETRLLERQENGEWLMMSYHWRDDQSDADAVPDGVGDASGTDHDIPSTGGCRACHSNMPDKVLGFSAVQLSREREPEDPAEWTLARLDVEGKLTTAAPTLPFFPGDDLGRDVLGYLHANCGHCHHPSSSVSSRVGLSLWLRTDSLVSVAQTPAYASIVGREVALNVEGAAIRPLLVAPGAPDASSLLLRMESRGAGNSMPPLATKRADPEATELVRLWIESLSSPAPLPPVP